MPVLEYVRTPDEVTIAHASTGTGPPIVMMPGVPFSNLAAEWRIPVMRGAFLALADELRLVQYDGRGTGHSQRDVSDVSFDAMLRDLEAVIAAQHLERFALLGFYHSCLHALAYAARHPERVTAVVLFGGVARGWDVMRGPGTQALLSLIEQDWDTFVESATHAWLGWPAGEDGRLAAEWFRTATTPAMARAVLREASAIDVTDELPSIRCPVLVLHRAGTPVPLESSQDLVERLPHGRLQMLGGTAASLFFETPNEVVDAISSFVLGDRPARMPRAGRAVPPAPGLSPRELDVLRLIAAGETNAEIARRLDLSINTVERHAANVYRKIEARGRADATAFAIRNGLA